MMFQRIGRCLYALFSRVVSAAGRQISSKIPVALDVSVTDYCNAGCGFCHFNKHQGRKKARHFLPAAEFIASLGMLRRNGVSFINFQGGEPLLHPEILTLVRAVHHAGMKADLITNGWKLPDMAEALADAGLHCLFVSLDSGDLSCHEQNRELKGLGLRLAEGIRKMRRRQIPVIASVTVSKLVDFRELLAILRQLGFDGVTFSYPRRAPFASSSLVYGGQSPLLAFTPDALCGFLEQIKHFKKSFPTLNPKAGIEEIKRSIRAQKALFPCIGGQKYYYLDWNLELWRCEAWDKPFGKLTEFDTLPVADRYCADCTLSCYRDTSVLMYAPLRLGQALQTLPQAGFLKAFAPLRERRFYFSLWAGISDGFLFWRIFRGAGRKKKRLL